MSRLRSRLLALALALTTQPLCAQVPAAPHAEYRPPQAVEQALALWGALGVEIKAYFPGPGNLVGVAAELMPGKGRVFYLDPTGTFRVSGLVINLATGENLTMAAGKRYLGELPQIATEAPTRRAEQPQPLELLALPAVIEGEPAADEFLVVFFDFRCGHCKRFYASVQGLLEERSLSVHWVPLNFGGDLSETMAAYALGGDTPRADMERLFTLGAGAQEPRHISALLDERERLVRGALMLERGAKYADRVGVDATPYLFHLRNGGVRVNSGAMGPERLRAWLSMGE